MGGIENVKRLYLDYLNAGFKKDEIARKLKAQFKGAKFTFKGATLYVQFGLNEPVKVLGTELNAATRLEAESSRDKLKGIARSFEDQLRKAGAPEVEVTFISDDEINIFTENKNSFERAKQYLKKVPSLKFKHEDTISDDPDFEGPQYFAWYKF
jgi:hypothetical protein